VGGNVPSVAIVMLGYRADVRAAVTGARRGEVCRGCHGRRR